MPDSLTHNPMLVDLACELPQSRSQQVRQMRSRPGGRQATVRGADEVAEGQPFSFVKRCSGDTSRFAQRPPPDAVGLTTGPAHPG